MKKKNFLHPVSSLSSTTKQTGHGPITKGENTMKQFIRWMVVVFCVALVGGCATYYKVTDPESGKVYYAEEVETTSGGSVKLNDARNGGVITLQNSEVREINEDEYKMSLSAPAAPAPTPAPAPSPTPGSEEK
jgi:uncharacterized protein YceK